MRTGRSGAGLHAVMSLVMVLGIGLCMPSWAFFPSGGFKQFENTPVLLRWSMIDLDVTGNGQVQTPQDGIMMTIDVGLVLDADEGVLLGFTPAFVQAIRNAFTAWQDVPGAYMAFRIQEIVDPTLPILEQNIVSEFNTVLWADLGGLVSNAFIGYALDDEVVLFDGIGQQFLVRGPRILEGHIVVSSEVAFTGPAQPLTPGDVQLEDVVLQQQATRVALVQASVTQDVGFISGLSLTPLNNSELGVIQVPIEVDNQVVIENVAVEVEEAVIPLRNAQGNIRIVGATPTMYPGIVLIQREEQQVDFHWSDLAPDDIAGIMYLYPRVEQVDDLFSIRQEARSSARPGLSSVPIVGAHVVAWVDHDRNPTTDRVPLFSTMTGLYNNEVPIGQISGRFQLLGMFKRMIDSDGNLFSPDYVITIEPLGQAGAQIFDSMHINDNQRPANAYTPSFPFQVYNEAGNLFNRNNVRNGTPLYFDTVRRQVVSRHSGLTLAQQLPRNAPMFGDESEVCFFDIIGEPGGGGVQQPPVIAGLTVIRGFRDNVMLRSRLGTAAADAYYRIAPPIASFLLAHETVLSAARAAFATILWLAKIPLVMWGGLLMCLMLWCVRQPIRTHISRLGRATATGMLILAAGWAQAAVTLHTPEQMVRKSDIIFAGEVTATHSYYSDDMLPARIVTDVTVSVGKSFKGTLNKGGTVTIRVPGGRVDDYVIQSSSYPSLQTGQEVLLFVSAQQKNIGLTLPYGSIGSLILLDDPELDEKSVSAGSVAGLHHTRIIARAVNEAALKRGVYKSEAEAEPDGFTLDAFAAFVEESESKAR